MPALDDGVLPGSDRWRQVLVRPGDHPMVALGLALGAGGQGRRARATSAERQTERVHGLVAGTHEQLSPAVAAR
jgi:hypothetical protein